MLIRRGRIYKKIILAVIKMTIDAPENTNRDDNMILMEIFPDPSSMVFKIEFPITTRKNPTAAIVIDNIMEPPSSRTNFQPFQPISRLLKHMGS